MTRGVEARRIAYSLAAAQHGVMARRQLREHGLSGRLVDHWLHSGYVLKVLPAVYALGRPAVGNEALWMAAVLCAGPDAVLAGKSAAAAWNIADGPSEIEVARTAGPPRRVRGHPPHQRAVLSLRKAKIVPGDVVPMGPIPVMSPARLLIDLAGRISASQLRRCFIEAGREGLLTEECLAHIELGSKDFKGRCHLLALQRNWDPSKGRIRSILEGEFRLMCAEQGLPAPLTNQRLGGYEVDCLWPEAKLIVELDGRKFHSDAVALAADGEKTRALRNLGFRVRRFTWLDVTERPEWVAEEIRRELSANQPRISGVILT